MLKGPASTIRAARILRRSMTLPEVLLWRILRTRPAGHKFRRQHPAGPYILDFYCPDAKLVVEIDGTAHDGDIAQSHDSRRDEWLQLHGLQVLRIPAQLLLRDIDAALAAVLDALNPRLPLHRAMRGPPPHSGEDQ